MSEKQKEILKLTIEKNRLNIHRGLEVGLITTMDIINLLNKDSDFGIRKIKGYKNQLLRDIFNCPFLLCDQEHLDLDIKKMLPAMLKNRYTMEIEELKYLYQYGSLSKEELKERTEILKFCYYKSSNEGQQILKKGHVSCVLDNVIRCR